MLVAVLLACAAAVSAFTTPLDEYIALPDPNYSYFDTGVTIEGPGYTGYILNMTSQQWLTYEDSDRSIWWHYAVVVVPHKIEFTTVGTVYITGGSNTDGLPSGTDEDILLCVDLALTDKVTCTVLFQIPNQPIVFAADPTHQSRSEDAMIAFTWYHFIMVNSSEPYWLARLPMTKAVVRCMDTVTDYTTKKFNFQISQFIVAGASKRGWTTWLTGAVDPRVIAIIPIVMDALNFIENVHHFWRAYGGWSFALKDYYVMNFTREIDLPNTALMADIIDPYVYRSRLTMPKLVIDADGDEFFMLDDNHYWWDNMQGEMHLLMVQNAEHSEATGLPWVSQSATSFIWAILNNQPRPTMTWEWYNGTTYGNLTLNTSEQPLYVHVYHADTIQSERRDWRLITGESPCPTIVVGGECFQPVFWTKSAPTVVSPTEYTVTMQIPESGWRGFFMEVEFPGAGLTNFLFTTQVVIIPNTFPYPACSGAECYGTLL